MATIKEVKKELRHREWAEEIAECQSSGMKIRNWCQMKGISCNTYYRRLQIVRTELLAQTEQSLQQIVPLSCGELGYECQGRLMPPLYFPAYVAIFGLICYNRYADYFTQR